MFEADDDDGDFVPAAGSKLASVFGLEKPKVNGNASLVYTPQKKPKPVEQVSEAQPPEAAPKPQASMPKFSVIVADIVHSFKLDQDVYTDQRKVGVAVLGNAQAHVFQILLYRTTQAGKQDYIAVAKINNDFRFLVQPKFYCSFYDETKNYWSLVFSSQEACMQFARQVGAAHFRAIYGKAVVTQMIDAGDEGSTGGDTLHLVISQQHFDVASIAPYSPIEPTIKVSVSPSQAKWSKGLVSANPDSKWAIFVPASTSLPWATEVSLFPLVLEVVVEKMLNSSASSSSPSEPQKISGSNEVSVESNSTSSKASLISRVARMGQATLPLKGAVFPNPTDSEDTEEETSSVRSTNTVKPPLKPKFTKGRSFGTRHPSSESDQAYSAKPAAPVTSTIWRPAAVMNSDNKLVQYVSGDGQMVSMPATTQQYQLVASSPVTSPSEPVSMFISEARIQNTEMRMNMNRIIDKIDTLSTKVDSISSGSPTRGAATAASGAVDAGGLLSSIEKLVKDNEFLRAEVADKNDKLNDLNERVFTLVNSNANLLEQNKALLDEKQTALAESIDPQLVVVQKQQIEALEKEKTTFIEKLADLEKCLQDLQDSNSELKTTKESELSNKEAEVKDLRTYLDAKDAELKATLTQLNNLQSSIERGDHKVKDAESKADRYEADNAELKELVTSLSLNINELETTIENLKISHKEEKTSLEYQKKTYEETIAQLKSELQDASQGQLDYDSVVMDLKVLVNKIYRKISLFFDGGSTVSNVVVRQAVGQVLKNEVTQYTDQLLLKKNLCIVKNDDGPLKEASTDPPAPSRKPVTLPEEGLPKQEPVVEAIHFANDSTPTSTSTPSQPPVDADDSAEAKANENVRPQNEFWRSEPPPVPKFEDEEENDEDWLNL